MAARGSLKAELRRRPPRPGTEKTRRSYRSVRPLGFSSWVLLAFLSQSFRREGDGLLRIFKVPRVRWVCVTAELATAGFMNQIQLNPTGASH